MRSHTLGELRRLFVSSAMLIAPAVQAAIGQRIGIAEEIDDMAAADLSPFELCLEDSIDNLEHEYEIFRPDFNSANPSTAKSWATSVSSKIVRQSKRDLNSLFALLPERERKRAQARLLSCGGVGAQWLASQ